MPLESVTGLSVSFKLIVINTQQTLTRRYFSDSVGSLAKYSLNVNPTI